MFAEEAHTRRSITPPTRHLLDAVYRLESMMTRRFVNDPESPSRRRALALARADEELHAKLLRARSELGLTQQDVAARMGVSQPTVASFERYDNDPKMSTVRRYAHAVGVTIEHKVLLEGSEVDCGWTSVGTARFTVQTSQPAPRPHQALPPSVRLSDIRLAA